MKKDLSSMGQMITTQLIDCNNCLGNSQAVIAVAQYGMDVKQIRLIRLRQIIDRKYAGFAGQFADAHSIKRPQVSRWTTKNDAARQGIAEESARDIEAKENLPPNWMDTLDDGATEQLISEEDAALLADFRALEKEDAFHFRKQIARAAAEQRAKDGQKAMERKLADDAQSPE